MLICLLVPHYDHLDQFRKLLPALLERDMPLVVVDDASPPQVFTALAQLLEHHSPDSILIRHQVNRGKGVAVMTGLVAAREAGFSHALQIDADGQHDVESIAQLVATTVQHPNSIVCGQPVFDESISSLRFYSRHITLYLVWLETLSTEIRDAMCGFRLYPLKPLIALVEKGRPGKRMTFDPEVLVRAVWAGISLRFVPVKIVYPEGGKSHFRYLRDNVEISWMHIRLIFGMLIRLPRLLWRRRSRKARRALQ